MNFKSLAICFSVSSITRTNTDTQSHSSVQNYRLHESERVHLLVHSVSIITCILS